TFIGGYSAKYGRSDGGVINQVGKRGSNEWTVGGQVVFTPKNLRGDMPDLYYPELDLSEANSNPNLPSTCGPDGDEKCQYTYSDPSTPGTLFSHGEDSTQWGTTYNLQGGGPIIKDKLFVYAAAEWDEQKSTIAPDARAAAPVRIIHGTTKVPK